MLNLADALREYIERWLDFTLGRFGFVDGPRKGNKIWRERIQR